MPGSATSLSLSHAAALRWEILGLFFPTEPHPNPAFLVREFSCCFTQPEHVMLDYDSVWLNCGPDPRLPFPSVSLGLGVWLA